MTTEHQKIKALQDYKKYVANGLRKHNDRNQQFFIAEGFDEIFVWILDQEKNAPKVSSKAILGEKMFVAWQTLATIVNALMKNLAADKLDKKIIAELFQTAFKLKILFDEKIN